MTIYEKLREVHAAIVQPVKDSQNPHFNSSFASLNECNRVVADAVRKVGECDYWQRAVYNSDARCWEMQTVFSAGDEEAVLSRHPFRDDDNPQKSASASTYARRYSLVSAFNLAAEDDDGNGAASHPSTMQAKQRLWAAVTRYAELRGEEPTKVIAELKATEGWQDTAEYYTMKAELFEREAMA